MSSLVYGPLTRKREEAEPGTSDHAEPPGLGKYVDTLAALVPSEVLGVHAVLLSSTTDIVKNEAGEAVTTITAPGTLRGAFVALLVLSAALYIVAHQRPRWDKLDYARVLIPPLAFVGWTMLQKSTAFDAFMPGLAQAPRAATAMIGALILDVVAQQLAGAADQKIPVP